jgi:hypothetical protein
MFHIKLSDKTSIPIAINNSAFLVDMKLSLTPKAQQRYEDIVYSLVLKNSDRITR